MKKITFLLIGLIALVACEAELETQKANSSGNENVLSRNGSTISPDAAAALAVEFRNSILNQSGQTRGKINEKGVASVYAWRSSDIASKTTTRSTASDLLPDTLLYIVNFEDSCGFALVSADAQIADVAAYVEKGTLTPNQEIDNPGFKAFLEGYGEYARGVRDSTWKMPDSLLTIDTLRHDKINNPLFGGENVITSVNNVYHLVYFVAPLLTTEWGQGTPYCNECPLDSTGRLSYAGCVAIAIAQVAAYYRYPTSYNGHTYNWNAILRDSKVWPLDTVASHSAAQLIHDIGLLVDMNYGSNVSRAYFDSIRHCLNVFDYHYSYNNTRWTDFPQINEDISNGYPVIIMGRKDNNDCGHAWVIDGVAVKRHLFTQDERQYVHCNWGYGGECNGYFIYRAFNTMWNIETDQIRNDYYGNQAHYYGYNYNNFAYHQIYPNNR